MMLQAKMIAIGSQVQVKLSNREGKQEQLTFVIVPPEAADFASGYLGANTPLARALIGESAGAVIPYLKDDIYSIEVVSVIKSSVMPPADAVEKREASLRKATRQVQDTSAVVFASSFSGKWGDYDPDSLPKEDQDEEEK